jgi:transposase
MNLPKKTTIEEEGLENYLNRYRRKHNDYGYTDFKKMLGAEMTKTSIAKAFNVSKQTVWRWFDVYKHEQG